MYHDRPRRSVRRIVTGILAVLVLAAVLAGGGLLLARRIQKDLAVQGAQAVYTAVMDQALQCYALEGAWPSSLEYLEQHYGLQINHNRYIVAYEVFASNQPPAVTVLTVEG